LLLSFGGLVLAFLCTGFASRIYHARRRTLAESWFKRGTEELQAGKYGLALNDFQTALIYGRGNVPDAQLEIYELDFSKALAATNHPEEARAYLLDLWEREPGSGEINLELARLAVRAGDDTEAKRYYNAAIYGIWEGDASQVATSRRETRLELFHYLTKRNEITNAQSVLMAIAAGLQPDASAELHTQLGDLMLETGDASAALAQYEQALRIHPSDRAALAGAGLASFALGDDRGTVRFLGEATREQARSAQTRQNAPEAADSRPSSALDGAQAAAPRMTKDIASKAVAMEDLAIAEAVLALDPYEARLDVAGRARRAAKSYEAAMSRLVECAKSQGVPLPAYAARGRASLPGAPGASNAQSTANGGTRASASADELAMLYDKAMRSQKIVREAELQRHPERIEPIMETVFAIEDTVTRRCGLPVRAEDAALARIARRVGNARS
jgi:tetratricopeptide (TPR) repeat protein